MALSNKSIIVLSANNEYLYKESLEPYYTYFNSFIKKIEEEYEPIIQYCLSYIDSYQYSFWISRRQNLFIRKYEDVDKSFVWDVFICSPYKDVCIYSTSKYYYDNYGPHEKKMYFDSPSKYENEYLEAIKRFDELFHKITDNYQSYIDKLDKFVDINLRRDVVSRKDYVEHNQQLELEEQDSANKFIHEERQTMEEFLKYLNTEIKPIEKITTGMFFEACKIFYQANSDVYDKKLFYKYEKKSSFSTEISPLEATAKDWYYNYADGRENGLLKVDENSHEDYLLWENEKGQYTFNGNHPWEIERGFSCSFDTHLYICKDNGYYFMLQFPPLKIKRGVLGYIALRQKGIPVKIYQDNEYSLVAEMADYIGIVKEDERITSIYDFKCLDYKVFDYRHLPRINRSKIIKKVIFEPIVYNKKKIRLK